MYFRITLLRSSIGLPLKTSQTLSALGLKKRMATVYHPVTPDVAGQIMRVKELVDVSEVAAPKTKAQMKAARRPDPGYYVEKKEYVAKRGDGEWRKLYEVGAVMGETVGRDDA
ncbi:uncharacterized protein BDR25DRAFT_303668 [Lindgomyces ingoldianus]|uniref:Uncharacterized protein n=1 Tax=Lindgomyces ingoldianus TaxID=673940 RepID=A0ACB6QUH1_9PLEO|nr:uncharacterized protein BDR25DRAFT_303668 [Lindgomyces ingoldianus]KAF2470596.1 hypothetical protein BDR25DRAFT_303668 [Lindgomyces ingoldianus]